MTCRGLEDSTQRLPQVATGPAAPARQAVLPADPQVPTKQKVDCDRSAQQTPPTPGSPSPTFSWHPFSYIPQSRALFSPLTSPTAPSGGTDQKPKTFSQTSILQKVTKESLALQNTSLEARSLERDQVSNHIVIIC